MPIKNTLEAYLREDHDEGHVRGADITKMKRGYG